MNSSHIRRSPAWTEALRIAKDRGYVRTSDLESEIMGQKRAGTILTTLAEEGKLFPRKSCIKGSPMFYFPTKEAADAYQRPTPSKRAKPESEHKKPGRPPTKLPKAPKPKLTPIGTGEPGTPPWKPKIKPPQVIIGLDKKPTVSQRPLRHFPHEVLPGEVVPAVVDSAQCRSWALAATERS